MPTGTLPSSFEGDIRFYEESWFRKIFRRLGEEPLIPLGVAGTCYAFYNAVRASKAGDSVTVNRMFRYRIYGQAFTVAAIMGGAYYYKGERLLQKNVYFAKKEIEAKAKTEAWIRELEARNEEEIQHRAKMQRLNRSKEEAEETESLDDDEDGVGGRGVLDAVKKLEEAQAKLERASRNVAANAEASKET